MLRRRLLLTLVLTPLASNLAFAQSAPTWPTRDVHVFVPQSAGSALDIVTRSVMEQVAPRLGQSIVVENRTGAGNTIAMAAVAVANSRIANGQFVGIAPGAHVINLRVLNSVGVGSASATGSATGPPG